MQGGGVKKVSHLVRGGVTKVSPLFGGGGSKKMLGIERGFDRPPPPPYINNEHSLKGIWWIQKVSSRM